jgi:hypothetical protein
LKFSRDVRLEEILEDWYFVGIALIVTIVFKFSILVAIFFQYFWMLSLNYILAIAITMMDYDLKSHKNDREFQVVNQSLSKTYFFLAS